jgi:hypothetical protein
MLQQFRVLQKRAWQEGSDFNMLWIGPEKLLLLCKQWEDKSEMSVADQ